MSLKLTLFIFLLFEIVFSLARVTKKQYDRMPEVFLYDDYDKCLFHSLEDDPLYCMVTVQLVPEDSANSSEVWNTIQEVNNGLGYRHDLLRHGVCTTTVCQKTEQPSTCLDRIYKSKYKNLGLSSELLEIRCEKENLEYPITTEDILFVTVVVLYVLFISSVSIWSEVIKQKSKKDNKDDDDKDKDVSGGTLLSALSVFENIRHFTDKSRKSQSRDYIDFLPTIRLCLSFNVILGHTSFMLIIGPVLNVQIVEKLGNSWNVITITSGQLLVSIFFVVSSGLLTVSFFNKLKKTKEIGFGYVVNSIVRRYIRLTVGQIPLIFLHRTWLVRFGRGFFWDSAVGEEYRNCKEKWWMNLLCINNFMITDGICLPHTWYLSVDFQFTVIGLIILWLTQKSPKKLFLAVGGLVAFQTIFLFFYLSYRKFYFIIRMSPELYYDLNFTKSAEWHSTWSSTYSNLAGLAAGLSFGYLSYRYQNTQVFTKKTHQRLWYLVTLTMTFGTYLFSLYYQSIETKNLWFVALWGGVNRIIFLFGVGLFFFGLTQGLGGILRDFLNWGIYESLGQLSFGAYLLHMSLLSVENGSMKMPTYVSYPGIIVNVVKHTALAYLGSFLLTIFMLMPLNNLSKMLF